MSEFEYKQRPSKAYSENWAKVFQPRPQSVDANSATNAATRPESLPTSIDGSGHPSHFQVFEAVCTASHAIMDRYLSPLDGDRGY